MCAKFWEALGGGLSWTVSYCPYRAEVWEGELLGPVLGTSEAGASLPVKSRGLQPLPLCSAVDEGVFVLPGTWGMAWVSPPSWAS